MILTLISVVWFVCAVFAYGLTLGCFQNQWPQYAYRNRFSNLTFAVCMGLTGPIGVFMALLLGGTKYGMAFRPISRANSEAAFRSRYPGLPLDW